MKLFLAVVFCLWSCVNHVPAFEDSLAGLLPRLRRFAHALSRNTPDADDLTQATVERAIRSKSQWAPGTRLDSWLYRIMRNLWIDTVRSRSRKARYEVGTEEVEQLGDGRDEAMQAAAELQRMMRLMQRLPAEQREVVALILIEGFGYSEAAEILDLPIGTVSSRLARGRTSLLQWVGMAG
jgi:RNA polymerase sigma factor (sigma-70 family)